MQPSPILNPIRPKTKFLINDSSKLPLTHSMPRTSQNQTFNSGTFISNPASILRTQKINLIAKPFPLVNNRNLNNSRVNNQVHIFQGFLIFSIIPNITHPKTYSVTEPLLRRFNIQKPNIKNLAKCLANEEPM